VPAVKLSYIGAFFAPWSKLTLHSIGSEKSKQNGTRKRLTRANEETTNQDK
jgi:hypothetical protein